MSFLPLLIKMKTLISLKSIFFLHLLVLPPRLIQCSIQISSESSNLIEKTCKQTPNYDLCISSLESDPRSGDADVVGLARIIADLVLGNATETLEYMQEVLKQTNEPALEEALANCAESYIPIVKYDLPQAIQALAKGHYKFANYAISEAGSQADICAKKFTGSTDSLLTDKNQLVSDLSAVATSILNMLEA